jgi:NAD(P)H-flavin reductase
LPIHYLLSLKAANPYTHLLHSSHEQLNRYHRVLGRLIYSLLILHIIFYNAYFLLAGKWFERFFAPVVFCGVVASLLLHAIAITAVAKLRDMSYRLFFITHLFGAFCIPILIMYHAKPARWYLVECIVIFATDLAVRKLVFTSHVAATLEAIPGTSLVKVSAPISSERHLDKFRATPGAHIYISLPRTGRKKSSAAPSGVFDFLYNPFSVCSVSEDGSTVNFVVRTRNGPMTKALSEFAIPDTPPSLQAANMIPLAIEGPYGSLRYKYTNLIRSGVSRVLLVAGGVGATFALPVYQAIQNDIPMARTQFIWAIRTAGDATWAVSPSLDASAKSLLDDANIQLFLTGDMGSSSNGEGDSSNGNGNVEMQPMTRGHKRSDRNRRRPDLVKIVDETFRLSANGTVAVIVCGPKAMMADVRAATRPWVMKGHRVWWHKESFGW